MSAAPMPVGGRAAAALSILTTSTGGPTGGNGGVVEVGVVVVGEGDGGGGGVGRALTSPTTAITAATVSTPRPAPSHVRTRTGRITPLDRTGRQRTRHSDVERRHCGNTWLRARNKALPAGSGLPAATRNESARTAVSGATRPYRADQRFAIVYVVRIDFDP